VLLQIIPNRNHDILIARSSIFIGADRLFLVFQKVMRERPLPTHMPKAGSRASQSRMRWVEKGKAPMIEWLKQA
jgi:hypothetical protein